MNRCFSFELKCKLKDEYFRDMNREQYYSAMHWMRYAAWMVGNAMNWDKFHKFISDSLLYGQSKICLKDCLYEP